MPAKTYLFQLCGRSRGSLSRSPSPGLQFLILCGGLFLAAPLYGFDIVADFSATGNPNGAWSYGWSTNAGGPFQLMSSNITYDAGLDAGWQNGLAMPNQVVVAGYGGTNPDFVGTVADYADDLRLDPQSYAALVRFTAPSNGAYQVNGLFRIIDTGTQAHDLTILSNSVATNFHVLTAAGQYSSQFPFGFSEALNQGDTLDFVVSAHNGNYLDLSTGLKATITPALGASYTWKGAVSSDWFNPTNWTPQGTPGGLDTVVIGSGGSPVVSNAAGIGSVILGSGAALNALAGLTVSNLFNWDGGSVTGTLTIGANATLNLNDPRGSLSLAGATLINNGTVVWDGGTLTADSATVVTNNGQWLAQSDDFFTFPADGSAGFYNNGSFVKSPTTSTTSFLNVAFNNAGTVTVNSGTLQLAGGGVLGGVFKAAAGARVALNGGTFTDAGGVFSAEGGCYMTSGLLALSHDISPNLVLAGGTVNLGPQFQAAGAITNLTIAGATLTGTNTVAGRLAWTGGEIDGALTINSGGVLDLNGSENVTLTAALTNAGTILWRGSSEWILSNPAGTNGGWINNLGAGIIDVYCDQIMDNVYGDEWLNNSGTLTKLQGRGVTAINVLVTNTGVVSVLNGSLDFNQPGNFGGSLTAANGTSLIFNNGGVLSGSFFTGIDATIDLSGGAFSPTASVSFGGAGTSEQTGGSITLLNNVIPNLIENGGTVNLAPGFQNGSINNLTLDSQTLDGTNTVTGTLTLNDSCTVTGPLTVASNGVLNVNSYDVLYQGLTIEAGGTVNWNIGSVYGGTFIASNAVLNVNDSYDAYGTVTNAGTVNWNDGYFYLDDGSGIYNLQGAVFNVNVTGGYSLYEDYVSGFFNNAGLIEKSTNANTAYIEVVLTNTPTATVDVQGGQLYFDNGSGSQSPLLGGVFQAETNAQITFAGGGALSGLYNAAANAVIDLSGGAFTYGAIPTFAGAGFCEITGGSLKLVSNGIPNLTVEGGTISLDPTFQGGTITNANFNAATLLGTNIVTGVLSMSGGSLPSGALTLGPNSVLNWGGGSIEIPLSVPSYAVMNFTGSGYTYLYSPLVNAGTINWMGGSIYLETSGAAIDNLLGAQFNAEGGYQMYSYYASAPFINLGSFTQTNTTGATYMEVPFNNVGSVNVAGGTLYFYYYGSALGGAYQAGAGGTIDFESGGNLTGSYTAVPGGTVNLAGGVFSNSASVLFSGGGAFQLNGGGTLTLVSNLIPNLQYVGGTVILSPSFQGGSITNLTLNGTSLSGTHVVTGSLTMNGGDLLGPLTVAGNAVLTLTGPNAVYVENALTNAGTIDWLGGAIYLDSTNAVYNLAGALFNIQCDQYWQSDEYEYYDYSKEAYVFYYAPFINAGTITKTNTTGLTDFYGPLLNAAGTVNVEEGTFELADGSDLTGTYYAAAGATLELGGGLFTNTLANTQFTGPGSYMLTGGSLYLAGNIITNLLLDGGSIYLQPGFQGGTITNLSLYGATLEGSNTVTGILNMGEYGYIYGPLTLAPNSVLNYAGGYVYYPITISSNAVMNLTGPNWASFYAPCTNQGTINWTGGGIYLSSPLYNLSGALFSIQCDSFLEAYGTLFNAGLLQKTNTLSYTDTYGYIANTGTVDVESGTLAFYYDQGLTGGVWQVGVSGLNSYGQFDFYGAATLTNVLNLNLENGLLLAAGDSFTPVYYGSESGTFSAVNFLPPQGANSTLVYGPNDFSITVSNVVAPVLSISSPTNYQSFIAGGSGASIPIQVTVSDADTTVLQVQYYQDGTFIASSSTGPNFPITWQGVAPGFYGLTAVATDGAGAVGTSALTPVAVYAMTDGRSYTWTGSSSANWSDPGNWIPAGVPGQLDNAFLNSGVVNLDSSFTVNNVIINGGVLGGPGSLTVNSGMGWTGGALNSTVTVGEGALLVIGGFSPLVLSNAALVNFGTAQWLQGDIMASNGVITNAGTWEADVSSNMCAAGFYNTGLLVASNGTASFSGGGGFDGTVEAANGATLNIGGTSSLDGSFTAAAGANISFDYVSGNFNYGVNPTFGGNGTISFNNGFLFVTNTISPNLLLAGGFLYLGPAFQNAGAISNLTLSGSALTGSNVVTGELNLTGGTLYSGQLIVSNGAYLNFSGPQSMNLEGLTLLNFGQVNWLGGPISGYGDAVTNYGQWYIESDNVLDLPGSTFVNNGTVGKIESFNTTSLYLNTFVNNGTIDAESGDINLGASGVLAGTYQTGEQGEIDFSGANMTLDQFPALIGGGRFAMTGGSMTIMSDVPAPLQLAGGTLLFGPNFQGNGAITNLYLVGATLGGPCTVTGVLNCQAGGLNGSLTIASTGALFLTGGGEFDVLAGALTNLGKVVWSGGDIYVEDNTLLVNDGLGLWVALSDNDIGPYYGPNTNAVFINAGTFRKQGTYGETQIYGVSFNNAGTVDAETGTINFEDGGQIGGAYNTAGDAQIQFNDGAFTPAASPSFTGTGNVQLNGNGSLMLLSDQIPGLPLSGGTVTLGPAFQNNGAITNLTIQGATLSGSNVVTGTLNFLYGNIVGPLIISNNATLLISSNYSEGTLDLQSGALTNFGTVLWTSGTIVGGDNTLFVNDGLWLAQSDDTIVYYNYYYDYNTSVFLNNGVFRKLPTTGGSFLELLFNNNGVVDAESGTIYFDHGGQIAGTYNAASDASIFFESGPFTNATPASLTGSGGFEFDGGSLTLLSDQIAGLPLVDGTVLLGPAFQNNGAISNLTMSGATLQGSNLVTGTLNWTAGSLYGWLTVAPGGLLNISSSGEGENFFYTNYYEPSTLVNFGTVNWASGYLYGTSQTAITNNGLWLAQCDSTLYSYTSGAAPQGLTFVNNGTFQKTATTGTTAFDNLTFINSGTLDVESGTVSFPSSSAYEQTVATLSFGASAAAITGRLSLSGNVNLDGTLTLNLLNGYSPVVGDTLVLMTYPSASGTFANFNLPPVSSNLNWQTQIGSSSASLRLARTLAAANTLGLSGTVTDTNHNPIVGAIVYAAITSATASNLIQNGSFESPGIGTAGYVAYAAGSTNISGWTVTGPPGPAVEINGYYWGYVPAEDGNQYFDPTGGGITQSFPTTVGTTYDLIFNHGTYSHHGINNALGVSIAGNSYAYGETTGGAGGLSWHQVVIPFTATSNLTTVSFTNLTGFNSEDNFVDNVQVVPPDDNRVLQAVTDANGNYQIPLANETFQVGVSGLAALGYNDIPAGPLAMNGANQVANFVATSLNVTNSGAITISTLVNPPDAGTATGGGTSYTNGESVTVTATLTNAGFFNFTDWTENGTPVSTNASYTFIATRNRTLTANFLPLYAISTSVSPAGAGTTTGDGTYPSNTLVTVTATAGAGWAFSSWTLNGNVESTSSSYTFSARQGGTLLANFSPLYSISASDNPPGAGIVYGTGNYTSGATATLTASPSYGYTFGYWSAGGTNVGANAVLTFTVSGSQAFVANYDSSNVDYYTCLPPPSGLVAWWPGNGNGNDIIGGNNGILGSGVTFAAGEAGEAFSFDGTSNATISVPASSTLNVGSGSGFTIEAWIQPSTLSQELPIAEWDSPGSPNPGAHFFISVPAEIGSGPGCVYANIIDTSGSSHIFFSSPNLVVTNAFQHVAVTYDSNSGVGVLYLNGANVAQQNLGQFTPQTTYNFDIGARELQVGSNPSQYWSGLLDEVSLYNRALASNEIAAIYSAGSADKCPPSNELLVNGGFENEPEATNSSSPPQEFGFLLLSGSQLPGWTIVPGHSVTLHENPGPFPTISGAYSVNTDGEGTGGHNADLYQDFSTLAGATYTLSFDWEVWQASAPNSSLEISVKDLATGSFLYQALFNTSAPSLVVQHVTNSFLGNGDDYRLEIQESPESGFNDNQFIADNFSVTGPPTIVITTLVNPPQAGATAGGGVYTNGATVSLFALATNASVPLVFSSWTLNGVVQSTSAAYSFTANQSATLVANFLTNYLISVSNNPAGAGSVIGAGYYASGSTATLTASPSDGYSFANWSLGGSQISTNAVLNFTASANQTIVANYAATNLTHVVTVGASPSAAASTNLLGAGTYTNGQSAAIFAPLIVTNPPNLYLFASFSLNGANIGSANAVAKTVSTVDPANLQYVANYTARSILPIVVNATANVGNPILATTGNLVLSFQFDRTLNTAVLPAVLLTNASAGATQPSVAGNGSWSSVFYNNDTYTTPPITIASNMDGTVQVLVSGATDTNGGVMTPANVTNFIVRLSPPLAAISAPANGFSCTTTDSFNFTASASSIFGIASLTLYANGTNQVGTTSSTNITQSMSDLAAGSYRLTAVAVDNRGLATTSAPVNVTINIPGTVLIDFEAVDASTNAVSDGALSAYLAGYGVTLTNVTANRTVAVQDDTNISGGALTVAYSGDNLLTETGGNGLVSYTLVFSNTYPSVSFWRTELLAGPGIATPAWQAAAYDTNGLQVGLVRENQIFSRNNLPAKQFSLAAPGIKSVTFTGNNSIGALNNLPLDDLLLSTFPSNTIAVSLSASSTSVSAPGQVTLAAQATETNGSISEIDFYEGQSLLGSFSGSGATNTLQDLAPGNYTFTAVATDTHGAVSSSTPVTVTVNPSLGVQVINFDILNTSSGADGGADLSNYLAGFGITMTNLTLGTRLEADKGSDLARGALADPSSPPNLFTQVGLSQPAPVTFTLAFANPVQGFGFTRVGLTPGSTLALHPAWTAHALDASGTELESVSEPLTPVSSSAVPARVFQLTGADISSVRFDSDPQGTASFGAVLLDDLVLEATAAASPLSIALVPPAGSLSAPATITVSANASDGINGAVDHVSFYLGPALIGVVSNSPYTVAYSNAEPGTYTFTAQVVDTNGYAKVSDAMQVTVGVGANSTLLDFDSPAAVANLSNYFASYGVTVSSISPGTTLSVLNQAGSFASSTPPTNVLTQTGSNGPVSFTLSFSNLLTQFSFSRAQLTANPFAVHPGWQVQAFDLLGVPLAQTSESLISSATNVAAATFTLQSAEGIASIAFNSQDNGLTTNGMLLDNFILTVSPTNLPPSVILTAPLPGQVYTEPGVIPVAASAVDPSGAIASVSFYANDTLIGSASSSPFSIIWTNSAAGSFSLAAIATDSSGLRRASPVVNISVVPGANVFGISQQPAGQTVPLGSDMQFVVGASGANLTYQWNQDNVPLPNQNSNVLEIAQAGEDDIGSYTVVVGSGGLSITSQVAFLNVLQPPGINTQPQSQSVPIGTNVTLSVGAGGTGPFTYQWTQNGSHIGGATNSSYVLTNAQPLNSGNYYAIVANSVGVTNSAVATVVVTNSAAFVLTTVGGLQVPGNDNFSNRISINPLVGPVIGENTNATSEPGEPMHDGKPGGVSIWYTWHASFTGVVSLTTLGSTFDTLLAVYTGTNVANLSLVAADDDSGGFFTSLVTFNCLAGTDYQIAVDGFQGATGTVVLGLPAGSGYRVLNPTSGDAIPVITNQPASNQVVAAGATVTLSVGAASASPLTFQWYFQNSPVAGANASQLVISNFPPSSAGNYSVLVANDVGSIFSANANVQLIGTNNSGLPSTSAQDKFGDALDLSASAGTDSLGRREDSGGDVRGFSVSQTFSTVGATKEAGEPNPAGQSGGASIWKIYTTQVAGTLHIDTTGSTFNTLLAVYTNSGVGATNFATLRVVASGFTTNYQISGQPSLNVPNVPAGLTFYVVVDGYNGVSGVATLNIGLGVAPIIGSEPQSRMAAPGENVAFSVLATGSTNLYYQWQFDSANIAGATASSYTVTNAQAGSVGSYTVIVSNVVGITNSAAAVLTLQSAPFILTQPVGLTNLPGQTASFSVTADGLMPLYYQWQFDSAGIAGATGTNYTIANAQVASSGSYTVIVSNSSGVITSAPAILAVGAQGAPTILTQPANLTVDSGQKAVFSVTASGVAPLFYQWYFNGQEISWATNSTLSFPVVTTAFAGSNSVVVRNSFGSVTSAVAVLIVNNVTGPTVAITSPANHSSTSASSVTVKGTAAGKGGITLVQLAVNGNLAAAAGTRTWSYTTALIPGTNILTATSFDTNGVASAPVTHTIFRMATSTLTLLTNRSGGIVGEASGAVLLIGKGYTVTGVPKLSSGSLFSNWMSGPSPANLTNVLSESPVLDFIMSSNLVLLANFGPNPFSNVAGAYNGLFPTNYTQVTESDSGFITATLTAARGAFSARMRLDGGSYPFSGSFSLTGNALATIKRSGKTPVTVSLHLNLTNPPDNLLSGYVSNADWFSDIYGERALFNPRTDKATAYAGKYTMLIPPGPGAPDASPGGYGAATFTNNPAGTAALAGHLGDGAAISQSVPISQDGNIPVYVPLYSGKGSLWGWLTFSNISTNTPPQTLSGDVSWIKTPNRAKPLYTNGFTVQTNVLASVYEPTNTGILPPTNYTLTISNASQGIQLVYSNITVIDGKFTNSAAAGNPTNKLSITFTPATGVMSLTFRPTGARANTTATGVVLQDQAPTNGAGWFLDKTNSGYFLLQP